MNSYDFLSFLAFPSTKTRKLLSFPLIIFFLLSTLVYVWIQRLCLRISLLHVSFFIFYFLFFIFMHAFHCFRRHRALFIYYLCTAHSLFTYCSLTVHGTHNHFIQKKILKMDPTALFTHLKIIFL